MALGKGAIVDNRSATKLPLVVLTIPLTCDNSYPTGGYALSFATELDLQGFTVLAASIVPGTKAGAFAEHEALYDAVNKKIKILYNNNGTMTEVADQGDLTGFVFTLLVLGY